MWFVARVVRRRGIGGLRQPEPRTGRAGRHRRPAHPRQELLDRGRARRRSGLGRRCHRSQVTKLADADLSEIDLGNAEGQWTAAPQGPAGPTPSWKAMLDDAPGPYRPYLSVTEPPGAVTGTPQNANSQPRRAGRRYVAGAVARARIRRRRSPRSRSAPAGAAPTRRRPPTCTAPPITAPTITVPTGSPRRRRRHRPPRPEPHRRVRSRAGVSGTTGNTGSISIDLGNLTRQHRPQEPERQAEPEHRHRPAAHGARDRAGADGDAHELHAHRDRALTHAKRARAHRDPAEPGRDRARDVPQPLRDGADAVEDQRHVAAAAC